MRKDFILFAVAALAACNSDDSQPRDGASARPSSTATPSQPADPLSARDGASAGEQPDAEVRPMMQAQVVLDRLGFTPGVVDGQFGQSTRNALSGFQEANGLSTSGELDAATRTALVQWSTLPATRVITIPADFAAGPFEPLPNDPQAQAKLPALSYESLDEKLAERFHTTVATLVALNPGGTPATTTSGGTDPAASPPIDRASGEPLFRAGQQLRVPNVGADRIDSAQVRDADWLATLTMLGVGSEQPRAERIVVSKSKGTLKAYNRDDKLIAVYTATMGSRHDPLPLGRWKVNSTSYNPEFHYNPKLFWDADAGDNKATLPPGPNGPVGVVWIDLNKPHYGIHGTPNPETIGRAQSHGCVRLTNWDAARLAQMVQPGTQVLFEA
jgi:lipoprotein-anchoring transpeptidase ErfK/SrfK